MNYNDYLLKKYINNSSDIISFINDKLLDDIMSKIKDSSIIVTSHLIHKEKLISLQEQFIFNLDNYISFIKEKLNISELKIRYILSETLNNKYNKILLSNKYYYSNIEFYHREFINMFMYKYSKNIDFLNKYIKLNKLDFNNICTLINENKKAHIYFEDITSNNVHYYINLIRSIS